MTLVKIVFPFANPIVSSNSKLNFLAVCMYIRKPTHLDPGRDLPIENLSALPAATVATGGPFKRHVQNGAKQCKNRALV